MIAIEFQSHTDIDLFDAARAGVELIQDVLSAITVVLGTTFPASELVQVARFDDADGLVVSSRLRHGVGQPLGHRGRASDLDVLARHGASAGGWRLHGIHRVRKNGESVAYLERGQRKESTTG